MSNVIDQSIREILGDMVKFRRDMHQNPELSMEEERTSRLIHDILAKYDIQSHYIMDNIGVHHTIEGKLPGDTIVLRADIDALPIHETTNLPFKSVNSGKMHACGHDLNTTYLLGASIILSQMKDMLHGRIKFIFQSGEETFQGAKATLESGIMKGILPKYQFAFHANSEYDVGCIGMRLGEAMAASDKLRLVVKGRGGHAGYPHLTIDPIVISAHIILGLQSLAARKHHPADPLVITTGLINGGKVSNVTPDKVIIESTIRYFNAELGKQMPKLIEDLCKNLSFAYGGECEFSYECLCPSLIVSEDIFNAALAVLSKSMGTDCICIAKKPAMGSEDFAFFTQLAPGMQVRIT